MLRKLIVGLALVWPITGLVHAGSAPQQGVWHGELEVQQQAGSGCSPADAVPRRIAVQGVGLAAGSLLVWGQMQPMYLMPSSDGQPDLILKARRDSTSLGRATPKVDGAGWRADWREDPTEGGCSFTQARLMLKPVVEAADRQQVQQLSEYLVALHAAGAALHATAAATQASPESALKALDELASRVPGRSDMDASLAQIFMESADVVHAMRQRPLARRLAQAANEIYRRNADLYPDYAALALGREARMAYRSGGLAEAEPLLAEALTILRQHARTPTQAASSILSQRGAWQLRAGDVRGALDSFAQALRVDEDRGAPPQDLAGSASNLAAALRDSGDAGSALALFQRALKLAESTRDTHPSLLQAIREHIVALQRADRSTRTSLS